MSDVIRQVRRDIRQDTLNNLLVRSLQAFGVTALASMGLGWLLAGRVLQPLHNMTATARRFSGENLHERFALPGPDDELKELADTFDELLGRLEAAFDSQKRFVANASHELRTPLAVMRAEVDVTLADPDASAAELRRMAEVVRRATQRSEALIDALLVSNLMENALRYNRPGGRVVVSTGAGPDGAFLRVGNTGETIDPAEVDGLFEPFVRRGAQRTGGPDRGVGLGLSIVRSVVTAHGGRVVAHPRSGGGLDIEVVIPR